VKFISDLIILNKLKQAESEIGYKLVFTEIPDLWIDGIMGCEMTRTWQKFGLKISKGANYFTVGRVENGVSSRFVSEKPQYQSWLGGYTAKLKEGQTWNLHDHFNLAVADQEGWLRRYGDPHSFCEMTEQGSKKIGSIKLGQYSGTLYEGGCLTHSDVGDGFNRIWLKLSAVVMSYVFNAYNPSLNLFGKMLRPQNKGKSYETLRLKGYIAIFDVDKNVKVVLYGNGVTAGDGVGAETFELIKNDILHAFDNCKIVRV